MDQDISKHSTVKPNFNKYDKSTERSQTTHFLPPEVLEESQKQWWKIIQTSPFSVDLLKRNNLSKKRTIRY